MASPARGLDINTREHILNTIFNVGADYAALPLERPLRPEDEFFRIGIWGDEFDDFVETLLGTLEITIPDKIYYRPKYWGPGEEDRTLRAWWSGKTLKSAKLSELADFIAEHGEDRDLRLG